MITDSILNILFGIANFLLTPLSNISLNLDIENISSIVGSIMEFFRVIYYLMPLNNFIPIILTIFITWSLKIVVALYKLIPFKMS